MSAPYTFSNPARITDADGKVLYEREWNGSLKSFTMLRCPICESSFNPIHDSEKTCDCDGDAHLLEERQYFDCDYCREIFEWDAFIDHLGDCLS